MGVNQRVSKLWLQYDGRVDVLCAEKDVEVPMTLSDLYDLVAKGRCPHYLQKQGVCDAVKSAVEGPVVLLIYERHGGVRRLRCDRIRFVCDMGRVSVICDSKEIWRPLFGGYCHA